MVKLVKIGNKVLINPEHISQIDVHDDYNNSAYLVYTITMYTGITHEIRLSNYYYPDDQQFGELYRAFPHLLEGTW